MNRGYSQEEVYAILQYLRKERLRLKSAPENTKGSTAAERMNLRRFVRAKVRMKMKLFYRYQALRIPPLLMLAQPQSNDFLSGFLQNRDSLWLPIMQRRHVEPIPEINLKNFSFVHNPAETMEKISSILQLEATQLQARLNFDDERCSDIGAFLVLQAIRQHMAPVFQGGRMNLPMQKVIDAVGLRGPLHMAPFRVEDHSDIWPFHLQQRRPAGKSRSTERHIEPQTKEIVADRFVKTVNSWLKVAATQRLSHQGRRLVLKIVGEALDNAERHSTPDSDDGDWAITGCLAKEPGQAGDVFRLYVAFLSVGASISDSIATCSELTRAQMDAYVRRHAGRRMREEELRTVFALQDGVTKSHAAFEEGRGGTGFQDIIEFFADLGDTSSIGYQARLAIVSGTTCINLAPPYMKGERRSSSQSERELWFNAENSAEYPPDPEHVFRLPRSLNGTLVSMAIALDPAYLEATANNG
jgi:hypothetical protein